MQLIFMKKKKLSPAIAMKTTIIQKSIYKCITKNTLVIFLPNNGALAKGKVKWAIW